MYKIPADFIRDQPWADLKLDEDREEMKYWRKHGRLHNWMHMRYKVYGGKTDDFNCVYVRLFEHDFQKLISDMKTDNMPHGDGFFFGNDDPQKVIDDIEYFEDLMQNLDFKKWGYLYASSF